jgi:hypothetical protein
MCICVRAQPLQSISMAEERQGEARADPTGANLGFGGGGGGAGAFAGGSLPAAAAQAQEPNLAAAAGGIPGLNHATLAALAASSLQLPGTGAPNAA